MIIYRAQKGAPLSFEEMDNNFRELDTRLSRLEALKDSVEGIGRIDGHDDHITITGTLGSDFGTFPLPKANLKPRGIWAPKETYKKGDLVTHHQTFAVCLMDHTSSLWDEELTCWQDIFSLPSPSPLLPLYERETLPSHDTLGKLALLMEDPKPSLIFFEGERWIRLDKGETL